jgi:hypothetical protein
MKIYISHAQKDAALAGQLAERLKKKGFTTWIAGEEVMPGENWAKKIGKALDDSELMIILFTPGALESEGLRQDIDYALGSKKFAHRVFSVFVGPTLEADKDMPWIFLKLPHHHIESPREFGIVVKEIQALFNNSNLSHSNA